MCGIVGIIRKKPFFVKEVLLKVLKRLEYRGYDSVGFATKEGIIKKQTGGISAFTNALTKDYETSLAIAHTRWATHGGVTQLNAHPHFNNDSNIFIVHNGIIDNNSELKADLQKKGVIFLSQTDSEIIPHYIDYQIKQGRSMKQAIVSLIKEIDGTFAILIFEKDKNKLYAVKRDSPLALGITDEGFTIGSDIYAFSDKTNKAIFFNDNEFAKNSEKNSCTTNKVGDPNKEVVIFVW